MLVKFPVKYENIPFTRKTVTRKNGKVGRSRSQYRYRLCSSLNGIGCCKKPGANKTCPIRSLTIHRRFPPSLTGSLENWDCYVGVSFLFRNDPTKNAEDLGYAYLPQEVVTKEVYDAYVSKLKEIDYSGIEVSDDEPAEAACANGVCPIR